MKEHHIKYSNFLECIMKKYQWVVFMCCISTANQSELGGLFKTQWSKQDWGGGGSLVSEQWHIRCHCAGMNMPQTCQHNYYITVILCHPNAPQKHSATCHSNWRLVKLASVINKPTCFETMTMKVVLCFCRKLPWLEPVFVHQVIEVRDMPGWYLCHFPRFAFQWLGCLH